LREEPAPILLLPRHPRDRRSQAGARGCV